MNTETWTSVASEVVALVLALLGNMAQQGPWDWSFTDFVVLVLLIAAGLGMVYLSGKVLGYATRAVNDEAFHLADTGDARLKTVFVIFILAGSNYLIAQLIDPQQAYDALRAIFAMNFGTTLEASTFFAYAAAILHFLGFILWSANIFRAQGAVVGSVGTIVGIPVSLTLTIIGYIFGIIILLGLALAFLAELGRPTGYQE